MNKHIINLADVELQPRPPQFAPTGAAAQRFDARVGHPRRRLHRLPAGKIGVLADSIRYVNRSDSQVGYWEGE